MDVLTITLTIAGAAALLNLWLGMRVSQLRIRDKVAIGDGGNARIAARMRAHANFVEYVPTFLILLGLVELARGTQTWRDGHHLADPCRPRHLRAQHSLYGAAHHRHDRGRAGGADLTAGPEARAVSTLFHTPLPRREGEVDRL